MGQNPMLEESLVEIRLGNYGVAAASALKDPALLANVRNYKRQIASRMLPLAREDISRKIPDADYHVSKKIDGEFCVLAFENGHLLTVNPGGTVRQGLPWQELAIKTLSDQGVQQALIAGELYVANDDDRRPRVHDVASVVRQPKSEQDLQRARFAVFDVISIDGENQECPYSETWQWIETTFAVDSSIHPVETRLLKNSRDIEKQFQQWVEDEGAEGLVVRSQSAGNFKIKLKHNIDAVVIGFTESTDDRQGLLHDLLLGVVRHDGAIQVLCRVGGGFSDENRRELLSDLQDMIVDSEYAEVNSDHVAYQMVEPRWVVEISCLDMIGQNTRGGPVNRMVLNWNPEERKYEVVRRLPLVSVISPQFVRLRDDKQCNVSDVRIGQITALLPVQLTNVDATEMSMANSQLLERDVYTKQLRGEMLVRKFLLWKTNKEQESGEFPAFVAAYVDFSPSRKTPLTRDVRVSNSESQIRALFGEFKESNIKKGWELHSSQGRSNVVTSAEPIDAKSKPASELRTASKDAKQGSSVSKVKPEAVAEKKKASKPAKKANKKTGADGAAKTKSAATKPRKSKKPAPKKSTGDTKKAPQKKKASKKKDPKE